MLDAYDKDKDELHESYAKALGEEKNEIDLPKKV